MATTRTIAVGALLLCGMTGCVTARESTEIRRTPIRRYAREAKAKPERRATADLNGDLLHVDLVEVARCHEFTGVILRRQETTVRSASSSVKTLLGAEWVVTALGLLGGGIALGIAPSLSDTAGQTTDGKETGSARAGAFAGGGTMLALGVTFLIVAIIDTVKVVDSTRRLPNEERQLSRRTRDCGRLAVSSAAVAGVLGQQKREIGKTDAKGKLVVSLPTAMHGLLLGNALNELHLTAGGVSAGTIDLSPYRRRIEATAWQQAKKADTADAYASFAKDHPSSPLAPQSLTLASKRRAEVQSKQRVAAWGAYEPRIETKKRLVYPGSVASTCCAQPVAACPHSTLLDQGKPYTVVASTKSHLGVAKFDTGPRPALRDVACWVPKKATITEAVFARRERKRRQAEERKARRQAAIDAQLAKAKQRQRASIARRLKHPVAIELYDKGFAPQRALLVALALDRYAARVSQRGVSDGVSHMLLRAAGFDPSGGRVSYARAINRLYKGVTLAIARVFLKSALADATYGGPDMRRFVVRRFLGACGVRVSPDEAGLLIAGYGAGPSRPN